MPDLDRHFPHWSPAQRQAVRNLVNDELRLERRRFYMTSVLVFVTLVLFVVGYTRTQDHIAASQRAANCVVERLIIRVTPLQPRGVDDQGKPLHYTKEQQKRVQDFRDLMLGALPTGLKC